MEEAEANIYDKDVIAHMEAPTTEFENTPMWACISVVDP